MKLALSIASVLIFCLNYWICLWVYPDSNKNWDDWDASHRLQMNLYAINIMLLFLVTTAKGENTRLVKLFINIGIGFSVSDVIDRLILSTTSFTDTDKILIPVTVIMALYNYFKSRK